MKLVFLTVFASLALAAPAVAAEATLEGYGGDGALLVGVGSGDSPFGDAAPAGGGSRQAGGSAPAPRDDGNLVLEAGPAAAPAQTAGPAPVGAGAPRQAERPRTGGGESRPGEQRPGSEVRGRLDEEHVVDGVPAERPPVVEGADPESSGSAALPFTGSGLALLLAACLGLAALGLGMRRLAAAQPRF